MPLIQIISRDMSGYCEHTLTPCGKSLRGWCITYVSTT